jgi:hypothetical protein
LLDGDVKDAAKSGMEKPGKEKEEL